MKNKKLKKGSALLITILMMGLLMTLTLGISSLVLREIKINQSIVDSNKAYYAAEAGVENALLELKKNLAGFEPKGEFNVNSNEKVDDQEFLKRYNPSYHYQYSVSNQSDSVPSFPDDQPIFVSNLAKTDMSGNTSVKCAISNSLNPLAIAKDKKELYQDCASATYRKLGLNETVIIPLYSTNEDGQPENVEDFIVEYYLNVKNDDDLASTFRGISLEKFDVLRWKIYGLSKDPNLARRTESIADFYPGVTGNSENEPVCIGTDGNFTSIGEERCFFPSLSIQDQDGSVTGLWSAARECYMTEAGDKVTGGVGVKKAGEGDPGCSMREFIKSHDQNYLVLTNMVNPDIVGITNVRDPEQLPRADIYYRVLAENKEGAPKLVKDFAEIKSFGFSLNDNVIKSLNVNYKAPEFLPVFNFALYRTRETAPTKKE